MVMGACTSSTTVQTAECDSPEVPEPVKLPGTVSTRQSQESQSLAPYRGESEGFKNGIGESGHHQSTDTADTTTAPSDSTLSTELSADEMVIPTTSGLSTRPLPLIPAVPFVLNQTQKGMMKIEPTRKFAAFCLPPECAPVGSPSRAPRSSVTTGHTHSRASMTSRRQSQSSKKINYLRHSLKNLSLMDLSTELSEGPTAAASVYSLSPEKSSMASTARGSPNRQSCAHLLRLDSCKDVKKCEVCRVEQLRGVSCLCSHFLCTECFCARVREVCTQPELLRKHDFAVFCPVVGCTSRPWNSYHVRKLLDGPTLQVYLDTLLAACKGAPTVSASTTPMLGLAGGGAGAQGMQGVQGPGAQGARSGAGGHQNYFGAGAGPDGPPLSPSHYQGNLKYIVETVEVLREQLRKLGVTPLEYIPLAEIQEELQGIFERVNNDLPYDEKRMDFLLMCMELNPVYRAQKEELARQWREEMAKFTSECLATMRGYVPAHIGEATLNSLQEQDGLTLELAKRLLSKKCLWLVRMRVVDIERIHEVDLNGRFNPIAQGLDIVELAAIYAAVPEKFVQDPTGKKNQWRQNLENALREMDKQRQTKQLPASKARAPCYKKQLVAPFANRHTLRRDDPILSGLTNGME